MNVRIAVWAIVVVACAFTLVSVPGCPPATAGQAGLGQPYFPVEVGYEYGFIYDVPGTSGGAYFDVLTVQEILPDGWIRCNYPGESGSAAANQIYIQMSHVVNVIAYSAE